MVNSVPKYKIPRPTKYFRCKDTCHAYKGKEAVPKRVYDRFWTCNGCGKNFQTKEWKDTFIKTTSRSQR